ncbi:Protein of unknown function [Halopseudomonas xinjiangensis]|uniref:YetF C-terminal domain-containing protein n=1 Tax=Halopseudomonas xinjiangensis TaxID=487184 RepID=A0A1H1L8M7_9GAMM|nr:YetF domain-containing protein [Halopseudomonas xinjiangensis]SDR70415.1 Protein of unknown function [Halopseudomonas xinjiangensis]
MESIWAEVVSLLGLDADQLNAWQMSLRAALVYVIGVAMVRLGDQRFIGKYSAFDVIMAIMIGSVLSRAITNPEDFFPKLAAAVVLVVMHYAFAALAFHTTWFGSLIKGKASKLVIDGEIQWDAMRRAYISEKDLKGALRENAGVNDVSKVKEARLERSGNIIAILKDD